MGTRRDRYYDLAPAVFFVLLLLFSFSSRVLYIYSLVGFFLPVLLLAHRGGRALPPTRRRRRRRSVIQAVYVCSLSDALRSGASFFPHATDMFFSRRSLHRTPSLNNDGRRVFSEKRPQTPSS